MSPSEMPKPPKGFPLYRIHGDSPSMSRAAAEVQLQHRVVPTPLEGEGDDPGAGAAAREQLVAPLRLDGWSLGMAIACITEGLLIGFLLGRGVELAPISIYALAAWFAGGVSWRWLYRRLLRGGAR